MTVVAWGQTDQTGTGHRWCYATVARAAGLFRRDGVAELVGGIVRAVRGGTSAVVDARSDGGRTHIGASAPGQVIRVVPDGYGRTWPAPAPRSSGRPVPVPRSARSTRLRWPRARCSSTPPGSSPVAASSTVTSASARSAEAPTSPPVPSRPGRCSSTARCSASARSVPESSSSCANSTLKEPSWPSTGSSTARRTTAPTASAAWSRSRQHRGRSTSPARTCAASTSPTPRTRRFAHRGYRQRVVGIAAARPDRPGLRRRPPRRSAAMARPAHRRRHRRHHARPTRPPARARPVHVVPDPGTPRLHLSYPRVHDRQRPCDAVGHTVTDRPTPGRSDPLTPRRYRATARSGVGGRRPCRGSTGGRRNHRLARLRSRQGWPVEPKYQHGKQQADQRHCLPRTSCPGWDGPTRVAPGPAQKTPYRTDEQPSSGRVALAIDGRVLALNMESARVRVGPYRVANIRATTERPRSSTRAVGLRLRRYGPLDSAE